MPDEIIDRLNGEINAALVDSRINARLADLGEASCSRVRQPNLVGRSLPM
jgi:hypothetical protein